jgi:hypothetical protein
MSTGFEPIDFDEFHRGELLRRLQAGNGALAAAEAKAHGALAFRLDQGGRAYTYLPRDGAIEIVSGDTEAETVVGLSHESWVGLVNDLESPPGLLYAHRAKSLRGDGMRFVSWEPVLRAMYQGRPIYDPHEIKLLDSKGHPLDPARSFTLEGDAEEMAHFLRTVGYILVRGVFSPEEVELLRAEATELRKRAVEGDRKSWWGRNVQGERVLCRVIHAGVMPMLHDLYQDPRVKRIAALADEEMCPGDPDEVNGVTVLWKSPGVVEGLADLPWHRDCGMGGHALNCPCLVCSVFLWPASPESGDLRFLPGSHKYSFHFADAEDANLPGSVGIESQPGDVSIHYGDVVHGSPPPTASNGPFRASVLLGYKPPGARHHRGESHYNDVIIQRGSGQVESMREVAAKS